MSNSSTLYVNAYNVHQGGGLKLLMSVVKLSYEAKVVFILDARLKNSDDLLSLISENISFRFIEPSIKERISSDFWLSRVSSHNDIILCFGNLPPIFPVKSKFIIFLQNKFLVQNFSLKGFSYLTRLRILVERVLFRFRIKKAAEIIVQTPSMKACLQNFFSFKNVKVIPFLPVRLTYNRRNLDYYESDIDAKTFLYVASGDPHKNHINLIDAWCLLAEQDIFPTLLLTIDESCYSQLIAYVDNAIKKFRIKVINQYDANSIDSLYRSADALIYCSLFESLGLPLLEAKQFNLPILAAELDYIRDLIDPEESFDPNSSVSIFRAVKRFLGSEKRVGNVEDAQYFIDHILGKK